MYAWYTILPLRLLKYYCAQEKKRIIDKEMKSFSKVLQLKDASEQEKSNLEDRLKLLRVKDQSYLEDLKSCKERLKESEETCSNLFNKINEKKANFEVFI